MAQVDDQLIVTRNSMNAAKEIFAFALATKKLRALTTVNNDFYAALDQPTVKKRYVETQDGHQMLVWVIYPPGFDESKKYIFNIYY